MTDFVDRVRGWFRQAQAAPTERKVVELLARGGISDDPFPSRVSANEFVPGISYFGLRLAGLHIADARRLATERLPLCVCLAEFETGGERRSIPFSIGPDVIRRKLKDAGVADNLGRAAWIELRDMTIVRPTPVNDANLSLYTGLFSVPGDDLVKSLLNVVGTVGTALANPAVGAAIKVADSIYDSFGSLLGYNQVQPLVAALIGSALTDKGSGYLLVANVASDQFDVSRARVVGGRLHWPGEKGGAAVTEFDYSLLALECFDTVAERGTGLAEALFGQPWAAVRKATRRDTANEALDKLKDMISASSELTENDRLKLLTAYAGAAKRLFDGRWPASADGGTRGSGQERGGGVASIQSRLANTAVLLADGDNQIAETLRKAAAQIGRAPDIANPESTDAEATRDADADVILAFAQRVEVPRISAYGPTIARRAAAAIAQAMSSTLHNPN